MTSQDNNFLFNKNASNFAALLLAIDCFGLCRIWPIGEFVKWFIEATSPNFEELSRREKRVLFKTHWLGAAYRAFEQRVLLPTGMILGLPLLLGFLTVSLNL